MNFDEMLSESIKDLSSWNLSRINSPCLLMISFFLSSLLLFYLIILVFNVDLRLRSRFHANRKIIASKIRFSLKLLSNIMPIISCSWPLAFSNQLFGWYKLWIRLDPRRSLEARISQDKIGCILRPRLS